MRAALTMDVLATDLADYLVRKGVRVFFRDDYSNECIRSHTLAPSSPFYVGTLPRDASRIGTRGGVGRGASVSAQRPLGA